MKNLVKFIEIPATDFARAVKFYETVLGVKLKVNDDCEVEKMAFFGNFSDEPNVAISWTKEFKPSKDGLLVSLNVESIDKTLEQISTNGGKISCKKTKIEVEGMGYFAHFIDSEGNRLSLYSEK